VIGGSVKVREAPGFTLSILTLSLLPVKKHQLSLALLRVQ